MKKYLLRFFALVAICLWAPSLWAQVTTSSVNGTITDDSSKEVLVGATVVAKHLPTGTTYGTITNAKGNFSIVGMRPGGPYTLSISYIGFETITLSNINLALGETETFNVKMKDGATELKGVVVTGQKGGNFNLQKTGAGSSFSRRSIERVPSVSRSIYDIAKLTPQSNGNGSFAGANSRFNSFQIDGAVNNDVFGLGTSGKNAISLEAIDALQVVIAPFDVRQSGFTGGGMNAITKSGTNTFHGSVYNYFYNQDFFGTTPGKDVKNRKKLDKQYENTVGFTFGGPIIQDKLFFFANGEFINQVYPSNYIAGDQNSKITKEEADKVQQKLKELGYDAGGYQSRDIPNRTYKGLFRLDWNINQAHHLTLRYSHINDKPYVFSNTPTSMLFYNTGYYRRSITNTIVAELNSKLNANLSNELRISYSGIRDKRFYNGKPFPFLSIDLGSNRQIQAGVDQHTPANELDQDIFSLTNNLSLNLGNHSFTFGTHNELFRMRNLFIANLYGAYSYRNRKIPNPLDPTKPIEVTGLEDFLKIGTADEIGPQNFNYSSVNTAVTNDPRWAPRFTAGQIGLYAQDEWKVSDKLRLTLGLRIDMPFFIDRPTANTAFNSSALAKKHGVTNNYLPPLKPLFSPRFGFRYTIDDDNRYLLRGGSGIFTGRVPFVWISNSFSNSGIEYARTSRDKDDARNNVRFAADPLSPQGQANMLPGSTEIDMVGKDFVYPQVWRSNLAFEARLPFGIKATLEGMYTKTLNNIRYKDLGLEETTQMDHGNGVKRTVYNRVERNKYSNLIHMSNSSKGYSYNLTATLSKDFAFGLDASVAYTFGETKAANDGLSSQAVSNWIYNYSNDINGDELYYSNFDTRHRIVGQLNYRVEYAKNFATTIGIIYTGQSGPRYSVLSYTDLNGDGKGSNDLAYLPETALKGSKSAYTYEQFLKDHPDIAAYKGKIAPRNAFMAPFFHKFDLHFAQDFFLNVGGRRHTLQLNADIINIGNLLNRGWGMEPRVKYNSISPLTYDKVKKEYSFSSSTPHPWTYSDINSRWRAQVGVKYTF